MSTLMERINLEAKKQILAYIAGEELSLDLSYEVGMRVFNFEQNLLSYFGTNPVETNVRDYGEIAIKFLNNAYPGCLEARNARNSIKLNECLDRIVSESKVEEGPTLK